MSLNLEGKKEVVAEVSARLAKAQAVVLAEYRGLPVQDITALRSQARACERSTVMSSTGRPRYSARTTDCALASRAEISATTSFLPSRLRLKVLLLSAC